MNLTQKKLVEKFLEKMTYEGVCGFFFTQEDDDEVIGIYLIIDVEYIKNYSETYVSGGPILVSTVLRNKVSNDIQNFLGLKSGSFYVGSIAKNCE